tara:strand:- start:97040 stop:98293 length:1254 start_codon:yes stop_codon:yes gene_type:complete
MTLLQAQDIIIPISATTTLSAAFDTSLDNTINGVGLAEFPSLSTTHSMSVFANSFAANNEPGTIDFDLGGSYLVDGFSFWNQNFFGPVPGENGIQEVIISSSNDGITYTPISGAPSIFAKVTCMECPEEQFSFPEVTASFIRFDVVNNWGEPTYVGFSEVAFSGSEAVVVENVINPVSATTTLTAQFGSSLNNTINGIGLDAFPSLSATHEGTTPGNSFLATNEPGSIDFDLGGSYLVDGLSFWNINAPGPGQAGIQEVVVSFSEDGITYSPITGAPSTFAQVMTGTSPAEQFSFTEITASYIRFDVVSNYGDPGNLVAFAEVAFSGVQILGTTDITLSEAISVYPNPANDLINIVNASNIQLEGIKIYDMNGRLIREVAITNNNTQNINLSDLTNGVYMFHIYNDQLNTVKRVIKK